MGSPLFQFFYVLMCLWAYALQNCSWQGPLAGLYANTTQDHAWLAYNYCAFLEHGLACDTG